MARTVEEEDELDALEAAEAPAAVEGVTVEAVAPLFPTEDSGAVASAILNLFPTMDLEVADGRMTGRARGPVAMARFRRRLREMRIRDTARGVLRGGASGDRIGFALNKQSAFATVPNFSTGGAPLGDIDVTLSGSDPGALVEWLCQLDGD